MGSGAGWQLAIYDKSAWRAQVDTLPEYEQAVLDAALLLVLCPRGINICESGWGKSLGHGLYEFRVRKSLDSIRSEVGAAAPARRPGEHITVQLRVFCTFQGQRVVLLLSAYDKKRDSSPKRQQREIAHARRLLRASRMRRG